MGAAASRAGGKRGISMVAVAVLATALALIASAVALLGGAPDLRPASGDPQVTAWGCAIAGLVCAVAGVGLLTGRSWAWIVSLLATGMAFGAAGWALVRHGLEGIVPVLVLVGIVSLGALSYLLRWHVRNALATGSRT
jgi:hypothetical protein